MVSIFSCICRPPVFCPWKNVYIQFFCPFFNQNFFCFVLSCMSFNYFWKELFPFSNPSSTSAHFRQRWIFTLRVMKPPLRVAGLHLQNSCIGSSRAWLQSGSILVSNFFLFLIFWGVRLNRSKGPHFSIFLYSWKPFHNAQVSSWGCAGRWKAHLETEFM